LHVLCREKSRRFELHGQPRSQNATLATRSAAKSAIERSPSLALVWRREGALRQIYAPDPTTTQETPHGTPRASSRSMKPNTMRSALISFLLTNLIAIAIAGCMSSGLIGLSMLSPDETHEVAPSAVD
jgi:hypothetical protein